MNFLAYLLIFLLFHAQNISAGESQLAITTENTDEIVIVIVNNLQNEAVFASDTPIKLSRMIDLPYHNEVNAASQVTALSPALLHAVIATESAHQVNAISPKGAFGLMQLMPATAMSFKVSPRDPAEKQILAGARYLKALLERFHGNLNLALAAYNAGPGKVEKYHNRVPPYAETQQYVNRVYRKLKVYKSYV